MNSNDSTLESFFLIRDIQTKKYLTFTTITKKQLKIELEYEKSGISYFDGVFCSSYKQAVRISNLEKAEEMFYWLNSINPSKYELLRISVDAKKIS